MREIRTITADLYNTLNNVSGLNNKVFPLIANEGTSFPFAVFQREGIEPLTSKDGSDAHTMTFNIKVITERTNGGYYKGLELAEKVYDAVMANKNFHFVTLQNSYEDFSDDAYLQSLTFSFTYDY